MGELKSPDKSIRSVTEKRGRADSLLIIDQFNK
jgi:hypothetical protein